MSCPTVALFKKGSAVGESERAFLKLDEFPIDLAGMVEIVCGPIADVKEYPEDVARCLIEGA